MKILVDEVRGEDKILVRLSGEDIKFIVSEYSLSFYLDDDLADKLAFQLGAVLQDRQQRKDLTNGEK